jgi:SAM-dependent methyltransferase
VRERARDNPRHGKLYYDHERAYRQRLARGWSGWSDGNSSDAHSAFEVFEQSPQFPAGGHALDLGCGGGEICVQLAQRGWIVIGAEFAPTALAMAQSNARRADCPVRFARADVTRPLPFVPGLFDLVIDNHVLHCLIEADHRRAFLASARDALKPGGIFFSANMSSEGRLDYEDLEIDRATGISRVNSRIWVSRAALESEVSECGLHVVSTTLVESSGPPFTGDEIVFYAQRI